MSSWLHTLKDWSLRESRGGSDDVQRMTEPLRQGIVARQVEPVPRGDVECDEVYVVAGHKGHPEAVKKRAERLAPTPERRAGARHPEERKTADLRDDPARRDGHDPDAGKRPINDDSAPDHAVHRARNPSVYR